MAVNIGPRIGIDGEKEYRKQINDLITQQKTFSAQMKELESSFDDNTSAMERNRKKGELLEQQIENQEKQVEELEKGLKAASEKYGDNATETNKWKQAVSNAKTELNKMKKSLNDIPKPIQQIGKSMQETGKKITSFGESFTKKVSAPVAALAGVSIAAFNEVDAGLDTVTVKTGATGKELESLQTSVKNLAGSIPTDFATAGDAIGEVNTRFGLTGQELEDLSGKFVKFAELNRTDVSSSVDKVQKLMSAFGVETKDAGKVLDALNKTGQNTGISMDTLESSMIKNSTALKNMGMDAYTAADFIGRVETSGANVEDVMKGMSTALQNASEDGKTLPEALGEFQTVMNSTASDQEKLNAAMELFGKKAGKAIYDACKEGSLSFESLATDASDYLGSVETTFENTLDAPDKMKVALNNLKIAGSDLGGTLLEIATPGIEKLTEVAEAARSGFESLTEEQQNMVGYVTVALAVGGPAVMAVGNLVTAAGEVVEAFQKIPGAAGKIAGVALPVGIAIGTFALLKAGIDAAHQEAIDSVDGLSQMLADTAEATSTLNSATGDLKKVMSETSQNIDDINSKAAVASDLVDELYDLDAVTSKTTAQQKRMRTIVGELNAMYPGLALAIDDTTGSLTKGKKEVKNYVDEAKKVALLEAYTTGAKTAFEKLASTQKELHDAQNQQKAGLETLTTAYHAYFEALEAAPVDAQTGQKLYTEEVQKAETAYLAAKDAQLELNGAVHDAEDAIADAEEECAYYTEQQEELSGATEESTGATENHTEAVKAETVAVNESSSALAGRAAELSKDVATAVSKIGEEIGAWDDLYQSTRESIEGQIKLFEEWDQSTELTASKMLANLQSQTVGMTNYASNMQRLSSEAVKSSDPNFKALVKAIADMGVDGAAEAQLLVDALDNDKELFNNILSEFGANNSAKDNLAEVLTYVEGDFKSRTEVAMAGVANAINTLGHTQGWTSLTASAKAAFATVKKEMQNHLTVSQRTGAQTKTYLESGYATLPFTAAQASQQARTSTETTINGMKLEPKVNKVNVPSTVTAEAKSTITSGVDNIHGQISKVDGARAAAQAAASDASNGLTVKAKMEITDANSAAANAAATIRNWFANNPITTIVRAVASATKHAEGGFTNKEQLSWLSEGDKPEVVIPLSASQRSNALELYEQTGAILGVQKASAPHESVSVPSTTHQNGTNGGSVIDMGEMMGMVASAAKRGMESADIRIYWDNREAGRIMKNMGVQFV